MYAFMITMMTESGELIKYKLKLTSTLKYVLDHEKLSII